MINNSDVCGMNPEKTTQQLHATSNNSNDNNIFQGKEEETVPTAM